MLAMITVYFMSVYFESLVFFVLSSKKNSKNACMNTIEILQRSLLQSFGNNDSVSLYSDVFCCPICRARM